MRRLVLLLLISFALPINILAQVENPQASNELKFLIPIYNRYIGNLTNYEAVYASAFPYAVNNTGLNSYYRELCTQISVSRIVRGANLTASDKAVNRLVTTYNQSQFRSLVSEPWNWLIGAPGFDCMIAANLGRNAIPAAILNPLLDDLAYIARCALNGCAFASPLTSLPALTPAYYQANWVNKSNSSAEETNTTATFLLAAAQLLPNTGHGALTSAERTALYTRARDLIQYNTTHCDRGCPFLNNQNLVINHGINPNPNYTMSWLTGFTEAGMLFRQRNLALPTDIFTTAVSTAIGQSAQALQNYLTPTFGYTGTFNVVYDNGNNYPNASFDFGKMTYTMRNADLKFPVNSSIPVDHLDSMNAFMQSGSTYLKQYIFSGNKVWHYICNLVSPVDCWAEYQVTPLNTFWQSIQLQNTAWSGSPPPGSIDSLTQWYTPGTTQLKTYIWSGNRVWHYMCDNGACNALYTQNLTQAWPTANTAAAGWTTTPPPSDRIDAISQYTIPGTNTLKTNLFKSGQMWSYQCDNIGTSSVNCYASYTKNLASFWQGITGSWTIPLPTDRIDSFHQYYSPDGSTLKTYVVRDNQIWTYNCVPGSCNSGYTTTLNQYFSSIRETYKWPFEANQGSGQIVGVTDWGMDATFQNDAFAAIAVLSPQYASMYTNVQAEELRRGRHNEPPLPPNFVNGSWLNGNYIQHFNDSAVTYLTDGWLDRPFDAKPNFITPNLAQTTNFHGWLNFLAGKNGTMAYLFTTNTRYWLKRFDEIIPGDLNQDFRVDGLDAQYILSRFGQTGNNSFGFAPVSLNFGK